MEWSKLYDKSREPEFGALSEFIGNDLWDDMVKHIEETYSVKPIIQHSCCGAAPGWNVKYKKGNKSICALYPNNGFFACMVTIGRNEATEAELLLPTLNQELQQRYKEVNPLNGAVWCMMEVKDKQMAEDLKKLMALKVKKSAK